jgi:hypothetical protein
MTFLLFAPQKVFGSVCAKGMKFRRVNTVICWEWTFCGGNSRGKTFFEEKENGFWGKRRIFVEGIAFLRKNDVFEEKRAFLRKKERFWGKRAFLRKKERFWGKIAFSRKISVFDENEWFMRKIWRKDEFWNFDEEKVIEKKCYLVKVQKKLIQ